MGDLDANDLKKLHEQLEEYGPDIVREMLRSDRFPTGMTRAIYKWLRASAAKPAGDAEAERPDAAGIVRVTKPRRRSASRKPTARPVSDWVVKAMTKMVEKDGPNVLDLPTKSMRRRLQEARPDRKPPSDEVIHDARLEVLDRLKIGKGSVNDR
jgi:hypothetical protein